MRDLNVKKDSDRFLKILAVIVLGGAAFLVLAAAGVGGSMWWLMRAQPAPESGPPPVANSWPPIQPQPPAPVVVQQPQAVPPAAKHNTEELIAALDKAFDAPAEPMKPALLIFPVVGAEDRVTSDGSALSHMATFAAVYTNRKHIDLCVPLAQQVLLDAGCKKAKTALDRATIQLCLDALGAKLYAIPKLIAEDDGEVLTVTCHGDGEKFRDRTFTHSMKPRDRRKVPGLIARSVREYLGVELGPDEKEQALAPQLQKEEDLLALADVDSGRDLMNAKAVDLLALLTRNPRCVLAWELAIIRHNSRVEAMRRFRDLRPPLECPRLQVAIAVQVRELGEPERAVRMLLPLAASHRGDNFYHSTMMKCAMLLKDEKLTRHVLERWRKADPGYAGCVARGERLTGWAWDARGSGWANTVTQEGLRLFEQRLLEAKQELEKALQINPSGWTAHARLLTVARGLGLPRAFVEEHFRRAVELRPRYAFAYETKLQYLQPRWHGTPEDLIEFGRQCAATGFWDEGIPRLFPYALNDCSTNPRDGGTIAEVFKVPEVWDAAMTYYRAAEKGAGPDDRKTALNQLVKWGIYGEHYDDVVFACQKLRGPDRINPLIFRDADELDFLYDLVHAKTGKLTNQLRSPRKNDLAVARTGAALAEGDCELAAKAIEQIETADRLDRDKAACYRAALAVGRKLQRDKRIDFKGAEELEAFLGARPKWRDDGDKLVCELPAQGRTALTFPVGLRHAVVSGTLEWTEGISSAQIVTHTRALRDQVILRYLPNSNNTVELVRNGRLLNRAPFPPGRLAFRLVFDRREDLLQPAAGIAWKAGVYDDVPGGFSIQVSNLNRPTIVTISDLRIELTD